MCVCLVCHCPLTGPVVKCAQCTRTAHAHCTTAVGDAVHCKACASLPPPPPNRGQRRLFRQQWQKGRPWLEYINDLMHCAACRMYPQPGGSAEWAQGTNNFRASAPKKHECSGPHHVALAMWVSNGQKSSALGTLPPLVRDEVLTAFRAVYQGEKSGGSLRDFPGDLSMIEISGGNVLPGYRSRFSARGILAAIAVPFQSAPGNNSDHLEHTKK